MIQRELKIYTNVNYVNYNYKNVMYERRINL